MLKEIKSKLDIHTLDFIKRSSRTMFIKIVGVIVLFFVSIILSNVLGPEGLGIVNFVNKLLLILSVLSMLGFESVLIKFIAICKGKHDNQGIASTLKTSLIFNGLLSVFIATIGAVILPYFLKLWNDNQDLYIPLLMVFVMLIPETLTRIYGSALNGYGEIWKSNLMKNQALGITFVAIGLLIYYYFKIQYTPLSVLILYVISRFLVAFIFLNFWKHHFSFKIKGDFNFKPMFAMAKPMLIVQGTGIIIMNLGVMILGAIGYFTDVGIYSVAAQIALIPSLFLQVSNATLSPKIADLFRKNKTVELQLLLQRITGGLALIGLMFILIFLIFGRWLLDYWGSEFQEAYWILVILATGEFINLSCGSNGVLLAMSGFEKINGRIAIFTLIFNIILNAILVSSFRALGVALATAISLIVTNIIRVIIAKRKTGILIIPYLIKNK